ncbi:MAG TPA: hypothetical protein VKT30_12135 [Caulobacteraceae bacterium]|nr:hypothetical protein [Caulobacteraceae bacterium]
MDRLGPRAGMAAAAVVALAALVLCVFGGEAAWRAWLGAAFLCISLPIGALGMIMIMRLVPGAWAKQTSPLLEAEAALAPLGAAAFVPVLFASSALYHGVGEHKTAFREAWLSQPFFIARTLAWILILFALARLLVRRPAAPRAVSCVGLILFLLFGTFAATDWVQALDPDFNSSGFGLYVISLQMLTAYAAAVCFGVSHAEQVAHPGWQGGLLLMLLLMWAYFAYMPYFISWSGDVPSSAVWYLRRGQSVWAWLAWLVAATRFGPAFLLLFTKVRNSRRWLARLAGLVVAGSVPEVAWLVLPAPPSGAPAELSTGALFIAAVLGVGGLFAFLMRPAFAWIESAA